MEGQPKQKITVVDASDHDGVLLHVNTTHLSPQAAPVPAAALPTLEPIYKAPPRRKRPFRNLAISTAVLLVLCLTGGVAYIWFGDHQSQAVTALPPAAAAEAAPIKPQVPAKTTPESVALLSFTNPVKRGENTTLAIQTLAASSCSISVTYGKIPDQQPGLQTATADAFGSLSWSWTILPNAPLGDWPVKIICSLNGKTAVLQQTLSILD